MSIDASVRTVEDQPRSGVIRESGYNMALGDQNQAPSRQANGVSVRPPHSEQWTGKMKGFDIRKLSIFRWHGGWVGMLRITIMDVHVIDYVRMCRKDHV